MAAGIIIRQLNKNNDVSYLHDLVTRTRQRDLSRNAQCYFLSFDIWNTNPFYIQTFRLTSDLLNVSRGQLIELNLARSGQKYTLI